MNNILFIKYYLSLWHSLSRLCGRRAFEDRYDTSVTITAAFFLTSPDETILAYGGNFPDGLSAGPLAYYMNVPLILTTSESERKTSYAVRYCTLLNITKGLSSAETV